MSLKEVPQTAEMPAFHSSWCLPTALFLSSFLDIFLFTCLFFYSAVYFVSLSLDTTVQLRVGWWLWLMISK